ncbi:MULTISPECIES: LysR family transcriptional regulator [unclassified Janthinobacterium]|uniref:LysR family transcriptional regulator n=1 Tax=unclassified Janthinobacterium TaxID=2610881 RepID=UPI0016130A99|nr:MULTISPECIES: LysR family transcriptional regulator [unclassified Janthinobacterium]MBB5371309.1 DNA-binding transcriptional LysR family regulator [Janthinobacterium sp. K2C7]MBB5384115.1 DNA-binding transcriptional LysR family regulator [Janthinobacterium sp. K2Li3]MBB5389425.1 DNA-binding transcriptional LysR family regulator [Janthinobacterium sp. K2E3]
MRGNEFTELKVFSCVANQQGFARAGEILSMSASSVSQTVRELEARVGIRLLNRTTRSVSLTEAGARLLERLTPVLHELDAMLEDLADLRDTPTGKIKLVTPRIAFTDLLEPLLGEFCAAYPEIVLDITVDDSIKDLVKGAFDIGIRLGEYLEDDVIAFPVSPPLRQIVLASPAYIALHGHPEHPRDLHLHRCINWRQHGTQGHYQWEFEKGTQKLAIEVKGPLTITDRSLAVSAALQGVGIMMWAEHRLQYLVDEGKLVPLLSDWCPTFPGFFAYYTKQRQMPLALRTLIDFMRANSKT